MEDTILNNIDYYTVVLNEKEHRMADWSRFHGEMKTKKTLEKEPGDCSKQGYVFAFDSFQIYNNPKTGATLSIKMTTVKGEEFIVIAPREIPGDIPVAKQCKG